MCSAARNYRNKCAFVHCQLSSEKVDQTLHSNELTDSSALSKDAQQYQKSLLRKDIWNLWWVLPFDLPLQQGPHTLRFVPSCH